ncbi:c-type cytochrome [Rhodopirellula sp.]|nr:PVC-type heme-binding CxxCH protein [Rhodopirellula sp.]MDB4338706.1 c-type cytochrome [Rubripirellula sp.]MDB4679109.1 c-type cytochrome [Rhodopirellula sp.]
MALPFFTVFYLGISLSSLEGAGPNVQQSLASLKIADGYQVRAIASEPMVVDPVSVKLDGQGNLWVVEMPDYPTGPKEGELPTGRLKVLVDTDHDGIFDQCHLYADGLNFPTGVQPYRNGAILTVAGKIIFIEDGDDDFSGDKTTVLFKGFTTQNQQLRANHPSLGPDGLIYVANGLRGGSVQAVDPRFHPKKMNVELRDRDFFFDPEGGDWGVVSGRSQFGLTIDDFGRRIGCSNRNPAMQSLLSVETVERDPLLVSRDAVLDVAFSGEQSRVDPIAKAWTTSNLHGGQFSAACGVFAPGVGSAKQEHLYVCEPTGYLVQRQNLDNSEGYWEARRDQGRGEFLASSNTWFRPVNLSAGIGDSFFVVDMARAVIEHPDFMPTELKERPDQRDGDQLGRIWQVSRSGDWPQKTEVITEENAGNWLVASSAWMRQCGTQFFLEQGSELAPLLEEIVQDNLAPPSGRARAAMLLKRFERLNAAHLSSLLHSQHERLRSLAISLSPNISSWIKDLDLLISDAGPIVLRSLCDVLAGDQSIATEVRIRGLVAISCNAPADLITQRLVSSVEQPLVLPLTEALIKQADAGLDSIEHLVERLAIASPASAAAVLSSRFEKDLADSKIGHETIALLLAWHRGSLRSRIAMTEIIASIRTAGDHTFFLRLAGLASVIESSDYPSGLRATCLNMMVSLGENADLRQFISETYPHEVRSVAVARCLRTDSAWVKAYLRQNWQVLPVAMRQRATSGCSSNAEDASWLLDGLRDGWMVRSSIDPQTAKRLLQHSNPSVAKKARALLRADPNREKVLVHYQSAALELGDAKAGKSLFVQHCSACHRIDAVGVNVGPDISDTRTKTPESLLQSILDPNAAIDSAFVQVQILTTDGLTVDGLLIDETNSSVTLQQQGGDRRVVLRDEIEQMQSPGVSLMPEGFEKSMNPKQMSDLISYLKNWRYMQTKIPGVKFDG